MPGYDPQKNRARRRPAPDDPAPVEALLGPAEAEGKATDTVSPAVATPPTVTKRLADPAPEPEPDAPSVAVTEVPAEPEVPAAPAVPAEPTAPPVPVSSAPAGSRVRQLAIVAAILAVVLLVILRRRRRA